MPEPRTLFLFFVVFALVGCTGNNPQSLVSDDTVFTEPVLNSERIASKFGSYGIEILSSDNIDRVSNLYSTHDGNQITRTLAVVQYPEIVMREFAEEHEKIVAGESIGMVFKSTGWSLEKQHVYFGELDVIPEFRQLLKMYGGTEYQKLAVHMYTLVVSKNNDTFEYAWITEIHSPEYLIINDLEKIYPEDIDDHRIVTSGIAEKIVIAISKIEAL